MSFTGTSKNRNRLKGDLTPLMPSGTWTATHKGTAYGILAPANKRVPKVTAAGNGFFYRAWWPGRKIMANVIEWAKQNPDCIPTMDDVRNWCYDANDRCYYKGENEDQELLNVAQMEGQVSRRILNAVDGGVVHEALHKLLTCQRHLDPQEVYDIIVPRWAKIANMKKYTKVLLDAQNIIEDIRIERIGCAKYKGIRTKMADLQDFILTQEAEGREQSGEDGGPLWVVFGTFRDVGLGYRTALQRKAIKGYEERNPEAFELVTKGEIAPILRSIIPDVSSKESIKSEIADDLCSMRAAFDLVHIIDKMGMTPEEQEQDGQQSQKKCCPKCNAPASKLRARPVAGQDDKIAIVCTVCGHMEIIDKPEQAEGGEGQGEGGTTIESPEKPEGQQSQQGSGDVIRWDDEEVEAEEEESGEGEGEGESSEDENDAESDAAASSEGDEGEDTEETANGSESDSEGDEDTEAEAEAESGEGDEGEESKSRPAEAGFDGEQSAGEPQGAGATNNADQDTTELGDLIHDAIENGEDAGLMDYAEALGGKVEQDNKTFEEKTVKTGEALWKPQSTAGDEVNVPRTNDDSKRKGKAITKSVKRECAYFLARLRQIVLGAQDTEIDDGVKKGRTLSKRFLAETYVSVSDYKRPERAFRRVDEDDAPSTACAVVVDESGSMGGILKEAGMMAAAIAQPLDSLGCAVQVHGIRSTWYCDRDTPKVQNAHRDYSVAYDIIKDYDEPYRTAEPRFSKLRASGGTPLADGVEFALRGIQEREEDNRIIFIITDGCPDYGHEKVIARQVRIAKEQGIHVIGIGIGYGAEYVKNVFPDYVWSEQVSELPKMIVGKLNGLMGGHRNVNRRKAV